jgi:hypothetical protein
LTVERARIGSSRLAPHSAKPGTAAPVAPSFKPKPMPRRAEFARVTISVGLPLQGHLSINASKTTNGPSKHVDTLPLKPSPP